MAEDTSVWPVLEALRTCLCETLQADDVAPTPECFCGITYGDITLHDYKDMAWIRLVSAFPSANLTSLDVNSVCGSPLSMEVEVGVINCAPIMTGRTKPDVEAHEMAALLQVKQMRSMRRAIQCCLDRDIERRLNAYTPLTLGDAYGGFWTVNLGEL